MDFDECSIHTLLHARQEALNPPELISQVERSNADARMRTTSLPFTERVLHHGANRVVTKFHPVYSQWLTQNFIKNYTAPPGN